jgi:hypothetical protein
MAKEPAFVINKKIHKPAGGDTMGSSNLDAPPPKLKSIRQARLDEELKDELYGDAAKTARSKVTLPKFSWDKE